MEGILEFLDQWRLPITILTIVLVATALKIALKLSTNRIVGTLVDGVKKTKNGKSISAAIAEQRLSQRSKTIASVMDNLATWVITITATVMILSELGIDAGALIAVSTIIGAAVGFGAQSLVKDVISGIFIVFEDLYGVGDQVKLGDVEGEVVRVRLRVTEIQGADSMIWYVRNGEILNIGNKSQKA